MHTECLVNNRQPLKQATYCVKKTETKPQNIKTNPPTLTCVTCLFNAEIQLW